MTKTQQYKQLRAEGMTYQKIADKFGVSRQAVHQAVNRRTAEATASQKELSQ